MLVARVNQPGDRLEDIVHAQIEMIVGGDALRPQHRRAGVDQGDDVARAGLGDDVVQARERANQNHFLPVLFPPSSSNRLR